MPRGVYVRTEKTSNIISDAMKGRAPWNKGLTKETDDRVIGWPKGRKRGRMSKEQKEDISRSMQGKWVLTERRQENINRIGHYWKGKKHSNKTRERMRKAHEGVPKLPEHVEAVSNALAGKYTAERNRRYKGKGGSRTPGLTHYRAKKFRELAIWCGVCGETREQQEEKRGRPYRNAFPIHHIDGNPVNNDPNNLIMVCWKCHRKPLHPERRLVRDKSTGRWKTQEDKREFDEQMKEKLLGAGTEKVHELQDEVQKQYYQKTIGIQRPS